MRIAYDTLLQAEVTADLAEQIGAVEPYRYECACCGEDVILAAVDSAYMVSHFRHRSGNSDVECEHYLGQYGIISTDSRSRKSKNERAEFYFDSMTKMFFLGIRFSEEEIYAHEQSSTVFELRTASNAIPIVTLRINNKNFDPDIARMIPIEKFSYNYYLSNSLNDIKRKYVLFNNITSNAPTFFKISGDDEEFRAKLVRSNILYTKIPYLAVYPSHFYMSIDKKLPVGVSVIKSFNFETMGRKFIGEIITINLKIQQIESMLLSWGYQLEASETLTPLWPPISHHDDVSIVNTEIAFIYSTFELRAHSNINVRPEDISKIYDDVTKVMLKPGTKIYRKNAELFIDICNQLYDDFDTIETVHKEANYYKAYDNNAYLFNKSGVVSLNEGTEVTLTPGSIVRHFNNGYLDEVITPYKKEPISGEDLLTDIMKHYKRTEVFNKEDYINLQLSDIAIQYITNCEKSGDINSAAKKFIKEGHI